MRGQWMAGGTLALVLGLWAAGAAQAKTYLVTLNVTSQVLSDNTADPGFVPFSFQQTWHTGTYSGGDLVTTFIPDTGLDFPPTANLTEALGGGVAILEDSGFTADLFAGVGLTGPLAGGYQVRHAELEYQGHALPTEEHREASLSVNPLVDTLEPGGNLRQQRFRFSVFGLAAPPLTGPLTEDDFITLIASGDFDLVAYDSHTNCAGGPCNHADFTFFRHYNGTYSAAVVESVPEPATWSLMLAGFGLAGVGLRARRRVIAA